MTFKIMKKLSPESLWDKYQQRSSQSNYATRYCRDLNIRRINTEHEKKSFSYSALKAWNVACVQTLLIKLKRGEKVEPPQPSRFSCSQVPQNQGTEFDWLGELQLFFSVFKVAPSSRCINKWYQDN